MPTTPSHALDPIHVERLRKALANHSHASPGWVVNGCGLYADAGAKDPLSLGDLRGVLWRGDALQRDCEDLRAELEEAKAQIADQAQMLALANQVCRENAREVTDGLVERTADSEGLPVGFEFLPDEPPTAKRQAALVRMLVKQAAEIRHLGKELAEVSVKYGKLHSEYELLNRDAIVARTALQPICDAVNLTCAPRCSLTEVIEAIAVSLPVLTSGAPQPRQTVAYLVKYDDGATSVHRHQWTAEARSGSIFPLVVHPDSPDLVVQAAEEGKS